MTNVTVKLAGGTEKENTTAVTVGTKRWGDNGSAFGQAQSVDTGDRQLTACKTTDPKQISITVQVAGDAQTFNVTVNKDTISVS